jgi:hypothetical protein
MGLDIVAFEHARLVASCNRARVKHQGHVVTWADIDMERSLRGLEGNRCYAVAGERLGFRAGSYIHFMEWRQALSRRALGVSAQTVWDDRSWVAEPFYELLNFSDCEGTIGPEAAADLAVDFAALRAKISAQPAKDAEFETWFMDSYDKFQRAFELAAGGNGLVLFC